MREAPEQLCEEFHLFSVGEEVTCAFLKGLCAPYSYEEFQGYILTLCTGYTSVLFYILSHNLIFPYERGEERGDLHGSHA